MIRELNWYDLYFLVLAMRWTLGLTLIALAGGGAVGLLVAICGVSANRLTRAFAHGYVSIVQGIPLLAWLFIFYFGFPAVLGINTAPLLAVSIAFSVYAGSFLGEIWRGSLLAIPRPQWEAGLSIGLRYLEQLRYVIIPQAIRLATPPTVGFIVQLIKNTSLAAIVGFVELTREGQLTTSVTFKPFAVYLLVAGLYFTMCYPLTRFSRVLEGRLRVAR